MSNNALQARIDSAETRLEKLAALKEWEKQIRSLESFDVATKVEVFDKLYTRARDCLAIWIHLGRWGSITHAAQYEDVLTVMLGKDVWEVVRAFQRMG